MDHPIEPSFKDLLEEAMDGLDQETTAYGIARKVLVDPDSLPDLTENQKFHWRKTIEPAMRRADERRNAQFRKELMDRDD